MTLEAVASPYEKCESRSRSGINQYSILLGVLISDRSFRENERNKRERERENSHLVSNFRANKAHLTKQLVFNRANFFNLLGRGIPGPFQVSENKIYKKDRPSFPGEVLEDE